MKNWEFYMNINGEPVPAFLCFLVTSFPFISMFGTAQDLYLFSVCLSVQLPVCASVLDCPLCPTCGHKQDASAEQDVVLAAVDTSNADTQPPQQQQDGAENGEQA